MIETAKSKRGGARAGAGRKRDPLKDLRTGAATAQKILRELNDEKEIPLLYKELNPAQKLSCIFKLREQGYGRLAVSEEQSKPPGPIEINVRIHRVGA